MLECVKADPNTYEYATLDFKKKIVDPSIFFLERGGSFFKFVNISAIIKCRNDSS